MRANAPSLLTDPSGEKPPTPNLSKFYERSMTGGDLTALKCSDVCGTKLFPTLLNDWTASL